MSTIEKEQLHVVYITQDKQRDLFEMLTNRDMHYVLKKTDVSTITPGKEIEWTELHTGVFSFGMEGDFLFISASDPNEKVYQKEIMRISKSGGADWHDVHVPSITLN